MSYSITFTGDDEIIKKGVRLYAECHGWTEDNEQTFDDFAQQCVKDNIIDKIASYASNKVAMDAKNKEYERITTAFQKGAK